eukprot:CAMPEP_0202890154 /NCGR_PEP_ID=MMETSP1392-20130828/658_1 /ASSEMBLY_ACC=CAM_ASM_000868 /TAXON_ID=225041 /ORGANISM="Chlamydomonas chlamydogama, Strain SAG 11-48b" /LENGTH=295 /DNA_ID=CAMNT_0049573673 /DNA_START=133 /DNA_END=1020 /DNA_ORIENTATION=+
MSDMKVSVTTTTEAEYLNEDGAKHRLSMIPLRYTKTIHFVRHGLGFHNIAGHENRDNYKSEEWFDAHLTEVGWQQAEALNHHIQKINLPFDLVVVSPLMRALETAVGAFGRGPWSPSDSQPPLMAARGGDDRHCMPRSAVSAAGLPPIVAHELCREHLGVHPCDRRHPTSFYRAAFPAVDFSLVTEEEDVLWRLEQRESKEAIKERGMAFMRWIMTRPERNIAVVTHSSFLHFTMQNFGHDASIAVQGELHRWYENCEMRSVVVADTDALSCPPDAWHFAGGNAATQVVAAQVPA